MILVVQTLIDGLVLGGIYALSAVGFSLIFGVMHVVNLSHGVMVLMAAYLSFFLWRALGLAIRATAQQDRAARLCGVDARHVYGLTFGVSAAFAGAAGTIIGIVLPFSPPDEGLWTLNAFVVVTLGGVGSPAGALLGGLLLGVIST